MPREAGPDAQLGGLLGRDETDCGDLGAATGGAAGTVNGATGTIECVRPNGRVDVALAAGQTLAGVRRGDVTFAGQDVSVVADAAVPPPVRWKERRAAHTDAGPPPWATAPKKRGVRERRS